MVRATRLALAFAVFGMVAATPRPAGAQGADIVMHGRVVAADNAPIAIAQVIDGDGVVRARVNERGEFSLRARRGTSFRVRALGYRPQPIAMADTSIVVRLDALPTVLSVMTTTVGARELRANESPRAVTVLQREDLDAAAAVSANQLLRQIPGLQEVAAPPSKTSISIRGFDDSRVLVLIDGEPVSGSLIDSRDIGRLSTLSTARIEVTKGPSSVEFGSDALGGVINLVQAAPTRTLTLDGQLRGGALGRREGQAEASQTLGRFGYRVGAGWRQVDRLPGLNSEGVTFNRVYDARGDFRVRASNNLTLRLSVLGSQERQRWPVDRAFNGFIDNRGAQGFLEAHYSGFGGSLRARAFEQRFSYQYRQSRDLLPIAGSADSLQQEERQRRYLLAYSRVIGAHTVDVGVQQSARSMVSPRKVEGDSARDDVTEIFVRDSWTRGPVLLTAGARHSSSSLWGNSTNPSVGLAWQANDHCGCAATFPAGSAHQVSRTSDTRT
jgi:outer membrane cobalamin receptor